MSFPLLHDAMLQIFNVEHGACALLTCPSANGFKRLMVDCGHNATTKWYPGAHLRRLGVTQLEQLVVTNYDEDHVSGFRSFAECGVSVQWMLHNATVSPQTIRALKTEDGMGPGIAALVDWLKIGRFPTALGSQPPQFPDVHFESFCNAYPDFQDENNLSLVLYLTIHGRTFLFPGDLECAGFERLLSVSPRFREVVGKIDVLVAAHHGRENGVCDAMFSVWGCNPQMVVVSDDYKQYNTQETTAWYSKRCRGVEGFRGQGTRKVLSTRSDGSLVFSFNQGRCLVS